MVQTLLDGFEYLFLIVFYTLQIANIGGKRLGCMACVVENREPI